MIYFSHRNALSNYLTTALLVCLCKWKAMLLVFCWIGQIPTVKTCMSITHIGQKPCTLVYQGRRHHIWSGQVHCAWVTTWYARGCRGMLPQKNLEIYGPRDYFWDNFWANTSWRPDHSKFHHGIPVCLGALFGCQPSSGANWQCQASHIEGKSGESGLTRPATTALYMRVIDKSTA